MGEPNRGNVRQWHLMSGKDFKELDKDKCVVFVTCSPMEVHGPHLPVFADNMEAEALTGRTIEKLSVKHPEITFLRLPTIYVACDVVPQTGSLMFRNTTIIRVLSDLGRTLTKQGFKNIWVASFHGGPRHFVAIEQACHNTNTRHGGRMVSLFSLLTKLLTEGTPDLSGILKDVRGIKPEELVGDTHGGVIETSLMLHITGENVKPAYKELPRLTVDIKLVSEGKPPRQHKMGRSSLPELFRGFKAALEYFTVETYSGAPNGASAEIGEGILDVLSGHTADALSKLWKGEITLDDCHSPVWKIRWVFTIPQFTWLFEKLVGHRSAIF